MEEIEEAIGKKGEEETRSKEEIIDEEKTEKGIAKEETAGEAVAKEQIIDEEKEAKAPSQTPGERYPIPASKPIYASNRRRVSTRKPPSVWDAVAALFVGISLALVIWLAIMVILEGRFSSPSWILYAVAFWLICAYLAIPRVHRIFSLLYVPDYFIGRTRTQDGRLGDPINLGMDGQESDIHAAMQAAGWVKADEITIGSSWKIILSSLLHRSYPAAPVSNLYLFGKRHAFAYQKEVDGSATRRHHVRFWPTPEGWRLPGGERVDWLAGGTFDRAVGLSLFTGQVTHKIDADTDAERDYIINTLRYADSAIKVRVIEQFSTAYHSRNGGGDQIVTDGDLPIVDACGTAERRSYVEPSQAKLNTKSIAHHHIPPPALFFAGAFALAALVLAVSEIIFYQSEDASLLIGPLTQCALWVMTLARYRWAWVGLMASSSITAAAHLYFLDFGEFWNVSLTVLIVYAVLAVSDSSVREWVRPKVPLFWREKLPGVGISEGRYKGG